MIGARENIVTMKIEIDTQSKVENVLISTNQITKIMLPKPQY